MLNKHEKITIMSHIGGKDLQKQLRAFALVQGRLYKFQKKPCCCLHQDDCVICFVE